MARLNDLLDSDDEFPELSTILGAQNSKQEHSKMPSHRKETQNLANKNILVEKHELTARTITKASPNKPQSRKQRPLGHLKQAHVDFPLPPMSEVSTNNFRSEDYQSIETADNVSNRASPRRLAKVTADYSKLAQVFANTSIPIHHDEDYSTGLSGFIVPDSASDGESLVSTPEKKSQVPKVSIANPQEPGFQVSRRPQSNKRQPPGTTDLVSPEEEVSSRICLKSPPSNEPFKSELDKVHPNIDDRLTL